MLSTFIIDYFALLYNVRAIGSLIFFFFFWREDSYPTRELNSIYIFLLTSVEASMIFQGACRIGNFKLIFIMEY